MTSRKTRTAKASLQTIASGIILFAFQQGLLANYYVAGVATVMGFGFFYVRARVEEQWVQDALGTIDIDEAQDISREVGEGLRDSVEQATSTDSDSSGSASQSQE